MTGGITLPRVDAVAARDPSGALWLSLTNVDPKRPAQFTATIAGVSVRSAEGQVLTGAAVDAHNSMADPNRVAPRPFAGRISGGQVRFDLPAKSIAVVRIR